MIVRVLNGPGDRFDVVGGPARGKRAVAEQDLAEAAAFDQPHREEEKAAHVADVVDRDDVVVVELRVGLCLVAETDLGLVEAHAGGVTPPIRLDQLEGDEPAGTALEGPVDDPHTARAEPVEDQVIAQLPADRPIELRGVDQLSRLPDRSCWRRRSSGAEAAFPPGW